VGSVDKQASLQAAGAGAFHPAPPEVVQYEEAGVAQKGQGYRQNGGWAQQRLHSVGLSEEPTCLACGAEAGTLHHR
jgi:hypothetical protein